MSKRIPSGPSGRRVTTFARGAFVAWDGEGQTRDGVHRYTLLASSEGDAVWQRDGLRTVDILTTICARARIVGPKAIHVIFGGSYDANCWLADCTLRELERIWAGARVRICHQRFRVQYRPRKQFWIEDRLTKTRVTVWDVWGFFQASFVGALTKYNIPVPPRLAAMKRARATFGRLSARKIVAYCHEECALLVALMEHVREHLQLAGLTVSRWDGAGAVASALLRREKIRDHLQPPSRAVQQAAQFAYGGGRIELLRYGHAPRTMIHHYDINSAYPAALARVPSLAGGTWERKGVRALAKERWRTLDDFTLVRVSWDFTRSTSRAYPFFWRAPDGSIYYPMRGANWVWLPEVRAASDALATGALTGVMRLESAWTFRTATDARPFAFVPALYEQRRAWKRAGIGAEKMAKLGLNSLYGKMAQHVGGRDGEAPRFHQLEYAGFITASTRATLYRAAALAGPDTIMIATDGIFSTEPLPTLPVSSALGAWDYQLHHGMTAVQSGVYWLDNKHEETGAVTASEYSRGFDAGTLSRAAIVRAWRQGETQWSAELTRFVTMGAIAAGRARADWRQWITAPRTLALTPSGTKRAPIRGAKNPARGLVATAPSMPAALLVGDGASAKYLLPWVDGVDALARTDDGLEIVLD